MSSGKIEDNKGKFSIFKMIVTKLSAVVTTLRATLCKKIASPITTATTALYNIKAVSLFECAKVILIDSWVFIIAIIIIVHDKNSLTLSLELV